MEFLRFMVERKGQILFLTLQHIEVSAIAVILSILIAVPLGILITRYRRLASTVVNTANVGQTVPSLAILGMVIPVLGIGLKPAVFALVLRAVLPIINNTYSGIVNVDRSAIEAGPGDGDAAPADPDDRGAAHVAACHHGRDPDRDGAEHQRGHPGGPDRGRRAGRPDLPRDRHGRSQPPAGRLDPDGGPWPSAPISFSARSNGSCGEESPDPEGGVHAAGQGKIKQVTSCGGLPGASALLSSSSAMARTAEDASFKSITKEGSA